MNLQREAYLSLVQLALQEDVGDGDATSLAVVPANLRWRADIVARQEMIVAGLTVAETVLAEFDDTVRLVADVKDGDLIGEGAHLGTIEGAARSILSVERTVLNFLQRLSGIATQTHRYVQAIDGLACQILDTRKTTPGWRVLEKYAVSCGGGTNHRMGLFDLVMIKDNHLAVLGGEADPVGEAVRRARGAYPQLRVEVEADTVEQAEKAAQAGADIILLDNMSPAVLRSAIIAIDGRSKTEASGGITLESIREVAETGVDFMSVGALTHSAPAVDIALDILSQPSP